MGQVHSYDEECEWKGSSVLLVLNRGGLYAGKREVYGEVKGEVKGSIVIVVVGDQLMKIVVAEIKVVVGMVDGSATSTSLLMREIASGAAVVVGSTANASCQ